MQRRRLLGAAGSGAVLGTGLLPPAAFAAPAAAAAPRTLGAPQPFDAAALRNQARTLAAAPWRAPSEALPPELAALDASAYASIRFRDERSLWASDGAGFQVRLFHRGPPFRRPVRVYEVVQGQARELAYDPALFDYGRSGLDGGRLPAALGFAGLRIGLAGAPGTPQWDVAAFLGGSHFRAVGGSRQYGLSARGLAVDTATAGDEEFPDFTAFYVERPAPGAQTLVLHALLDAPRVAGAYRFAVTPGDTTAIDVDAALYARAPVERLGIAPCSSMFFCGENDRQGGRDWRPEVHDSDGLAMHSGSGEWIWRPLQNPEAMRLNAFADQDPRGFGLLQRDRSFESYQDDANAYERRPSLWIEPRSGWGRGQVQLLEIPAVDEAFDNVIAFWSPADRLRPGDEKLLAYRMHWGADAPVRPPLARCRASRNGLAGTPGQPRRYFAWRFVVDFVFGGSEAAGSAAALAEPAEAVVSASRGRVERLAARPLASMRGWRATFDVVPDAGTEAIGLRLFVRAGGRTLTETWLSEWTPPSAAQRIAML